MDIDIFEILIFLHFLIFSKFFEKKMIDLGTEKSNIQNTSIDLRLCMHYILMP